MLSILLISVVTATVTLSALFSSLDDAEAINVAGSLRMQSYRLAFDIETESLLFDRHIEAYELSLNSPALKSIDNLITPQHLIDRYNNLVNRWTDLKPQLQSEHRGIYVAEVAEFVNQIDIFVFELQKFSQTKMHLISLSYGMGFIFTLGVALYVIYFSQKKVVSPLKQLMVASKEVQSGNFGFKIRLNSQNELGVLANAFNGMARELEKLYTGLEQKVTEKTHRLEHAKNSLEVLYNCQQELGVSHLGEHNFRHIIESLQETEGVTAVRMIVGEAGAEWTILSGEPSDAIWHSEALVLDEEVLGTLEWQYTLPCPDQELIGNVAKILSRGIYYNKAQKQAQQLLLMEERATIARELHDSIAQSLSYLKIQTTLLNRSIAKENVNQASETAKEIDKQLSATYTQLRELLSTFRLTIEKADLGEALLELLKPLEEQTDAEIILDNKLASISLRANHQVHVIQLVREAVINSIKHASPKTIKISCQESDGRVDIRITDDGTGFCTSVEKLNHYGLTIMSERADRLEGNLNIDSKPGEGCTIQLSFPLDT
ncbi:nitrate/nitrite two-component system sensor histidine kinase NarQ [Vibrio sp. JC009]|nr:nitrate/nitrite two-component system sensor histidine kinase NarQ [Vibrio sp. JC009]WED24978.1 nitrate/nitrite two-component system sensor histidine kinase NarQ [Vibrio sp. JC009]